MVGKIEAEAGCPNSVYELHERKEAIKLLKKTWTKIAELDREYVETGRPDIAVQLEHMKKQCMEIMENVKRKENME